MSVANKRILSSIAYYTLIALTLAFSAFFIFCVSVKDVQMWVKVVYYIWTAVVIGTSIFDVICTNVGEGKFISGLMVYVLSVLAVAMACILYFMNVGMPGLAVEFFNLFVSVSIISLMTSGLLIASWAVGENRVEHSTTVLEKNKN